MVEEGFDSPPYFYKILTLQSQVTVATRTVAISLNSIQQCLLTVVGDKKKVRILLTLGVCRGSCLSKIALVSIEYTI